MGKRVILIASSAALALCVGVILFFALQGKNSNDIMVGLQKANGESYYYNIDGEKQYGWQTIDGKLYYFDPVTGAAVKGWFTDEDGETYYFGKDGWALTGEQTIDGVKYTFDSKGRLLSDIQNTDFVWEEVDGQYYCIDKDGNYLTGLQLINGSYYYFDENGVRQSGLQIIDGKTYYFNESNGRAAKGWKTIDGQTYYFGADGSALTGTHTINGKIEEFDEKGRLITGASSSRSRNSSSSQPASSGNQIPAIDPEPAKPNPAQPMTGKWVTIDGKTYFQNPDGSYKKGIVDDETGRYFCDPETGERKTGLITYNNETYYFDPQTGKAISGWLTDPNNSANSYYFSADGTALKNLQVVAGMKYYFHPKTGVRQSGLLKLDGKIYYFAGQYDSAVTGWHTVQQEPVVAGTSAPAYAVQQEPQLSLTVANAQTQAAQVSTTANTGAAKTYYFSDEHFAVTGLQRLTGPDGTTGWFGFGEDCGQLKGWHQFSGYYYLFNDETGMALTNAWVTHPDDFDAKCYLGDNGAISKGLTAIKNKLFCFDSDGKQLLGRVVADGNLYFFEGEEGAALTSTWHQNDEGERFYLGSDGAAYVGVRDIGSDTYYFAGTGVMQTGWQTTPNGVYYLGDDGKAAKNTWKDNTGKWYYLGANGAALTGIQSLPGRSGGTPNGTFYFNSEGVQEAGWQTVNNKRYLFEGLEGRAVTGEFTHGANKFLFGADGAALSGVHQLDGKYYFYDLNAYLRKTGWVTLNGAHYYFNPNDDGAAWTGWFTDSATRGIYYFGNDGKAYVGNHNIGEINYVFDGDGRMIPTDDDGTGVWEERDGYHYYIVNGQFAVGLQFIVDEGYYYFSADGAMQYGWQIDNNRRYYFASAEGDDKGGRALTEWHEIDGNWYYFGARGDAYTGVIRMDDGLYCFAATGERKTGLVTENGVTYFFDPDDDGRAHTGWWPDKVAEGDVRYFDESNNAMAVGKTTIETANGKEIFLFNESGVRQSGLYRDENGSIYGFFGDNNAAIAEGRYHDPNSDKVYYFSENGVALVGLHQIGEDWFGFRADGSQMFGFETLDGSLYYFDPDNGGAALKGEQKPEGGDYTYYFHPECGHALTGIVSLEDGTTYVIGADGRVISTKKTEGFTWKIVGDTWYYTNASNEPIDVGIVRLDGFIYLFDADGAAAVGPEMVKVGDEKRYYLFGADGKAHVGWYVDKDGNCYYYDENGVGVRDDVLVINEETYEFDEDGKLLGDKKAPRYNDWDITDAGKQYYDASGTLAVGLCQIDGDFYYFDVDFYMVVGPITEKTADGQYNNYYFGEDGKAYRGWHEVDGVWYCFDESNARQQLLWQVRIDGEDTYTHYYYEDSGEAAVGQAEIAGVKRYFFPDGHMAVGLVTIDEGEYSGQYYFYNNGAMATGVVMVDGTMYSFDTVTGKAVTGWNTASDGRRYYFTEGTTVSGWREIDGRWYYFDETDHYQKTGWQNRLDISGETHRFFYDAEGKLPEEGWGDVNGVERYIHADGHMAVGWVPMENDLVLKDGLYYFDTQGKMATGETYISGVLYPFDNDGVLAPLGWRDVKGSRYYYTPNGAQKGWFTDENGTWYLMDEVSGKQKLGFQTYKPGGASESLRFYYYQDSTEDHEYGAAAQDEWTSFGGVRRYFFPDGHMALGWETVEDKLYYFLPNTGEMATGLHIIDGVYFSFDADGQIQFGWNWSNDGKRYYLSENGAVTGWNQIEGRWYFMDSSGAQQMGWQTRVSGGANLYYYYDKDGELPAAGWAENIDGARRYVLADGQMARGLTTIGSARYYFNEKGACYTGWQQISGRWYVFGGDGAQLTGYQSRTVSGYTATYYYFANGELPAAGWNTQIDGVRRYVLTDGELPSGWLTLGAYQYYFGPQGVPYTGGPHTINGTSYGFDGEGRLVSPPIIDVSYETGNAAQKKVTITGTANTLLGDKTLQYSFDGGNSWSTTNSKQYAAGTTIPAGTLQIRDTVGNVTKYNAQIVLDAAKTTLYGIDVSSHQGYIDWVQVKNSGVEFAVIRSLHWSSSKGYYAIDPYFEYNVRAAKAQGIKVGTYLYSYAFSETEMAEEITYFMNSAEIQRMFNDGVYFDLPVFIDYEDPLITKNTGHLTIDQRTNIVRYGMQLIEGKSNYRFTPGFYVNRNWAVNVINGTALQNEGYDLWLAHWGIQAHGWSPQPAMWQYNNGTYFGDTGVPGISGRVDKNYLYKDYSSVNGGRQMAAGASASAVSATTSYTITVTNQHGQRVTGSAADIIAQVVMAEVGGFGNAEVYKAQAVAAQSWIRNRQLAGYEAPSVVLATPTDAVRTAVNQVVGQVLTYNGQPAMTTYFAYGNGMTNNDKYWNAGNNMPYLQCVPSPYDAQSKPAYTGTISESQLRERFKAIYGYDITAGIAPQDWIKITGRNAGGYITGLNICGRTPKTEYFYLTILPYASGGRTVYPVGSPDFDVSYSNGTFTFTTRGYGHCVGMSQTGAYGYAQQGYSYQQILAHYYPGTQIGSI